MYAVIASGGKQHRVAVGDVLKLERLGVDPGDQVDFGDVRLVAEGDDVKIGTPQVAGASVKGTVLSQGRHRKVIVFKKKRRKGYQRTKGHRQDYTEVRIDAIEAGE